VCTKTIIAVPWVVYIAGCLYASYRASTQRVGRAPGLFWQFERETYNEIGWQWQKRSMWIFAGAIPLVLVLALIAKFICQDWSS
jgi:hypothetical protein